VELSEGLQHHPRLLRQLGGDAGGGGGARATGGSLPATGLSRYSAASALVHLRATSMVPATLNKQLSEDMLGTWAARSVCAIVQFCELLTNVLLPPTS